MRHRTWRPRQNGLRSWCATHATSLHLPGPALALLVAFLTFVDRAVCGHCSEQVLAEMVCRNRVRYSQRLPRPTVSHRCTVLPRAAPACAGQPLPRPKVSFTHAKPSLTHQVLVALMQANKLQFLVSQNVDGLHIRSGVARDRLAELHGNCFAERCHACGAEYVRDFEVETVGFKRTSRKCSQVRRRWPGAEPHHPWLQPTLLCHDSAGFDPPAAWVRRAAARPHFGLGGCAARGRAGAVGCV